MQLPRKSRSDAIPIEDFYAIKLKSLWEGVKKEHICFWALCTYYFFDYVRPQSIYPVIDILPYAQITIILTTLTAFMDKSVKWVSSPINKQFILFSIIIVISGIFAFHPMTSWDNKTKIINWLLVYFLTINIVNTEKRLFIFIFVYLLYSFKMSQHGFFSWAGRGFSYTNWGLVGAGGFFHNSGEFAIQMVIFGSLSLSFVYALRSYWGILKKMFFYFMPFTAFMSVMGASSRGAQLAVAIIVFIVILKMRVSLKYLLPTALIILAMIAILPEEQKQRFTSMGEDRTSQQRLEYWEYGMDVLNQNPLTGIGYSNWHRYIILDPNETPGRGDEEPHNIFIKVGAELGYLGLICFIAMIITTFVVNSRTRKIALEKKNRFIYYLSHGLDAGLLGYIVAGFFVTVVYYPFFWVQMAMSVALYSVAQTVVQRQEDIEQQSVVAIKES